MLERLTAWLAGDAAADLVPRHLAFNTPLPGVVCLALLAAAGALTAVWYARRLRALPRGRRTLLVALRTAAVVLLLFLALDPAVIAQRVNPGEQFVALLFDDSLSMRITDENGQSRGDRLQKGYALAKESFEDRVRRRHQIVRYRVGDGAQPLRDVSELRFDQKQSDLLGGIQQVVKDLQGMTVSAVVLFSDGVQLPSQTAGALAALPPDVPVFTVGAGESAPWSDLEITNLQIKRTDFDRSPVVLTVKIHSTGLAGSEAVVEAAIGSRVVKSKTIAITDPVQNHEVSLEFVPDRQDWIEYEARVRLADKPGAGAANADHIAENNLRQFAIDNRPKQYRILYVSGRPNWQNKFFRMALEGDDKQLKLTSLIAISNAEQKFEFRGKKSSLANPLFEGFEEDKDRPRYDQTVFLRLGAAKDELTSGFPTVPEDLFKYDLLIFGDLEKPFFTGEQLDLTRDFVDRRGGALLLMGGPRSFTTGGYAGTPIEKMLPMLLYHEGLRPDELRTNQEYNARPTVEGRLAGSWTFEQDEIQDLALWQGLPPLYSIDRFPLVRAGATVMAVGALGPDESGNLPLFLMQRYGEGRCAVFATGDTWQWKMRAEPSDDRHERFWRQIVRNLVKDTPTPALWRSKADAYTQEDPANFEFLLRDKAYQRREALQCSATVTSPDGATATLPIEESLEEAGLYRAPFTPSLSGLHRLAVVGTDDKGEAVTQLDDAFLVQPDYREFQQAQYKPEFLSELARSHSGRFFTLDQMDALADAIPVPPSLDSEDLVLHLWHLPGFFIVLAALLLPEWYLRRKAGQA
jgi:uncharacterized membrane protein